MAFIVQANNIIFILVDDFAFYIFFAFVAVCFHVYIFISSGRESDSFEASFLADNLSFILPAPLTILFLIRLLVFAEEYKTNPTIPATPSNIHSQYLAIKSNTPNNPLPKPDKSFANELKKFDISLSKLFKSCSIGGVELTIVCVGAILGLPKGLSYMFVN